VIVLDKLKEDNMNTIKLVLLFIKALFESTSVYRLKYLWFLIAESMVGKVSMFNMELPNHVQEVIAKLDQHGLKALVVGGSVRDQFYGAPSKDIDIEVYGTSIEDLLAILQTFGKVDIYGQRFGVIKLFCEDGLDLDISVPRIDNNSGIGKTSFDVDFDPGMMPDVGARRRDLTINSMAYDPQYRLLLDFYGGVKDINAGIVRATSSQFEEDPTRVYRGLQFAARLNLVSDQDTATRITDMLYQHYDIKSEMIWEEWKKFFLKGRYFAAGFQFLEDTKLGALYPEIMNLRGCQQQVQWHPEGDVWKHTILVLEAMRGICEREGIVGDNKLVLMFAALCHDFGKPSTTVLVEGKWRAIGHCQEGVVPTISFLKRISCPDSIAKKVITLVESHLDHASFSGAKPSRSALGKIKQRIYPATISELVLLVEADQSGRYPLPPASPISDWVLLEKEYGLDAPKFVPLLTGKDLINAGLRPGKVFSQIIKLSEAAELEGIFNTHPEAIVWLHNYLKKQPLNQ
jgi:tRNA nucleotidyltransferase (CCA-adding enzyme)